MYYTLRRLLILTYAGSNMGTTLLIATSTAIASQTGNTILTRTLTGCVIAGFTR